MGETPLTAEPPILGRYRLIRELGRGGAATVYLAHDWVVDREVAVKVLREELSSTVAHERFAREIRLMSRIQHPHILPILDCGQWKGQLFYIMPAVRGESLDRRLRRDHKLTVNEVLRLAGEISDALTYAHSYQIIHRDVKPGNIMEAEGHAWLADFGVARVLNPLDEDFRSASGIVPGTTAYMSPEQAAGDSPLDARTDQYSLACVIYEALTGTQPFIDESPRKALAMRLVVDPVPIEELRANIPAHVSSAVARAMARAPNERWPDVAEFWRTLSGRSQRAL
jgi:eukaryotic-like serine/threonine-protein kinase